MTDQSDAPSWLPAQLREWLDVHREALEVIYDRFDRSGEWPDPVHLQREVRAAKGIPDLARIVSAMPRELGRREYQPQRVVLSLLGVGCCRSAQAVMDLYFLTFRLALDRHSTPHVPNRVARSDVDAIAADSRLADRVSRLIVSDCPFLGGGAAEVDAWDLEIDERIVEYELAGSAEELLAAIARQRGLGGQLPALPASTDPEPAAIEPAVPSPLSNAQASRPSIRVTDAAFAFSAIAGTALSVVVAPLPWALAASFGFVSTIALARWVRSGPALWWAIPLTCSIALGAAIGVFADRDEPPAPIATQLDEVVSHAAVDGMYPTVRRTTALHRPALKSHIFVLRDQSERPGGIPRELAAPPSDEIRIYDESDGRLRLALQFRPQNHGDITQGPDGDAPGFRFRVVAIEDLDKDGAVEILGAFDRISHATGALPIPVLIVWDSDANSYRMGPLFSQPPDLRVHPTLASETYAGYHAPTRIEDQLSDLKLTGYPADVVAIRQALRGPVVLAGYPEISDRGFTRRFEAKGWFLDLSSSPPSLTPCSPPERHIFVRAFSDRVVDALSRAIISSARSGCGRA